MLHLPVDAVDADILDQDFQGFPEVLHTGTGAVDTENMMMLRWLNNINYITLSVCGKMYTADQKFEN